MGWTLSPRSWAAARSVILGSAGDLEKPASAVEMVEQDRITQVLG